MNKLVLLKMVNVLLALTGLVQVITVLYMKGIGMQRNIVTLHVNSGYVFIGLALLHLFLNIGWFKILFFFKKKR